MFRYNARFSRLPSTIVHPEVDLIKSSALINDAKSKDKMKEYSDKRNRAHSSELKIGDKVLLDVKKAAILSDKKTTRFADENYVITGKNGSMITASNERHSITRNSSFFKKASFEGAGENVLHEYDLSNFSDSIHSPAHHDPVPVHQPHIPVLQRPPVLDSIASSRPRRTPKPIDRYGYSIECHSADK